MMRLRCPDGSEVGMIANTLSVRGGGGYLPYRFLFQRGLLNQGQWYEYCGGLQSFY